MMKKFLKMNLVLTVLVLLFSFASGTQAYGATALGNDNHTDTADYCMRAHDVTINLSQLKQLSGAALEGEIANASNFAFLIRNSAPNFNNWTKVTSGYTIDLSQIQQTATTTGYPITVALPQITATVNSTIVFRLFVVDDLPEEPAGPTDPTDPTNPTDPTDPIDPGDSVTPVTPTEPTPPTDTTSPSTGTSTAASSGSKADSGTAKASASAPTEDTDSVASEPEQTLPVAAQTANGNQKMSSSDKTVISTMLVAVIALGVVLVSLTGAFTASIVSDFRVIIWYNQQKLKRIRGHKS